MAAPPYLMTARLPANALDVAQRLDDRRAVDDVVPGAGLRRGAGRCAGDGARPRRLAGRLNSTRR